MTNAQISFMKDFLRQYTVSAFGEASFSGRGVRPDEIDQMLIYVQICDPKYSGLPIYCAYIKNYEPTICLKRHGSEFISDGIIDFHFETLAKAREVFKVIFGC